ncbi:MAG: amidohydrolase family protein, partial [Hadesarchaea archaeon]|nr:amidohydrolase family protein [Hadesarchaea archaeon]
MVDLFIKNGLIVTMDKERRIIPDGSISIEDGRIVEIGRGIKPAEKPAETIDARYKIVMPGLICSHTHLYGMLLRGAPLKIEPPTDFSQILARIWWPMDEAMTREDAYASALVSCMEFIKTGTTFFADTFSGPNAMTGVLDRIAAAVEQSGMRGIIAFEATERRTHAEGARGARESERFIKKVRKGARVLGMFSIHASFTVSDELLHYVRELASRYKVPITIHTSEGLIDLYHNYERFGKRTIERL